MNSKKLDLIELIEKIHSNDTSLGGVLEWQGLLLQFGVILYFGLFSITDRCLICRLSSAG